MFVAGGLSEGHGIGHVGGRGGAARGFVNSVVEEQMNEIAWVLQRDGRQAAEVHEKRAVTVDSNHLAVRQGEGEAGGDG